MESRRKAVFAIFVSTVVIFCLNQWSYLSQSFIVESLQTTATASAFTWTRARPEARVDIESQENPARALIDSIREATRQASGASKWSDDDEITDEERETWNRENPCLSRAELIPMYDERKQARKLPPNPLWDELFTEYSKLHRACMRKVGNLSDYFVTGNVSTGCKFVVANVANGAGLGNKFMASVSALLYAILTQRVFLILSSTLVPYVTCQPFMGSSWLLDFSTFPVRHFSSDMKNASWTLDTDFFDQIDKGMKQMNHTMQTFEGALRARPPASERVNAVRVKEEAGQPFGRFYCAAEQAFFSDVTWVYLSSFFYTIPRLFAAPPFRPVLESLFPDKMVTTRLFRSAFLPSDTVWDRVLSIHHAYIDGGDRIVGIQLRYGHGLDQYKDLNDLFNYRIVDCAQRDAILPDISTVSHRTHSSEARRRQTESAVAKLPPNPVVKVFIACLFPGLLEHLSKRYVRGHTATGEDVALIQISQNYVQWVDSVQEDEQAFAEVLLLSLSDQLIVSFHSTFGGLAQAYGALTPWMLETREDKQLLSCIKGQTVDPCNMATDKIYRCSYDARVNEKSILDSVPYMKHCLEEPYGMQMMTDF